jgi:hypothetical protein
MYLYGLRGAVRRMKWDISEFDAMYGYLSSQTHSSPVSYLRIGEHGVDFANPTGQQFGLSAVSLEWATGAIEQATADVLRIFPIADASAANASV